MITLREFLKIADRNHYRIYQSNRDCLIFESFYKVHSPYKFDEKDFLGFNYNYWDDNDYCGDVLEYRWQHPYCDKETSEFLDRFGDYEVFGVESSSFRPCKMYKDLDDDLKIEYLEGLYCQQDSGYMDCLDIYITPGH